MNEDSDEEKIRGKMTPFQMKKNWNAPILKQLNAVFLFSMVHISNYELFLAPPFEYDLEFLWGVRFAWKTCWLVPLFSYKLKKKKNVKESMHVIIAFFNFSDSQYSSINFQFLLLISCTLYQQCLSATYFCILLILPLISSYKCLMGLESFYLVLTLVFVCVMFNVVLLHLIALSENQQMRTGEDKTF